MKTYASSPHSASRGQSLVEFAISLTFMLILLSGTVFFGIGLFYYIAMRDAAQEGALVGSMRPPLVAGTYNCADAIDLNIIIICARVQNASGADGLIANIYDSLTVTVEAPTACEGNGITVTLEYDYHLTRRFAAGAFLEPFLPICNGEERCIQLRASVTDTILTPPCPTP